MIRDYAVSDFRRISEINKQSYLPAEPDWFLLESIEAGHAWVALDNNEIIGYLIGKKKNGVPYINNVAVIESFRNKGVATQLITKFEEYFGKDQKPENKAFWLQVRADNPAQKLYFDLGYRVSWVDEHYYGRGLHALCMHKSFKPISNSVSR